MVSSISSMILSISSMILSISSMILSNPFDDFILLTYDYLCIFCDYLGKFYDPGHNFCRGVTLLLRRFHTGYAHHNTQTISFYRRFHTVYTVTLQFIYRFYMPHTVTLFSSRIFGVGYPVPHKFVPKFCK